MEETFGQRLSRIRKEKGLTQEDIAKKIIISPQAVSKWENDISSPDILVLSSLADILGVSVDELLGRSVSSESGESNSNEREQPESNNREEKQEEAAEEVEQDVVDDKKKKKTHVDIGHGGIHVYDEDEEVHIDSHGIRVTDRDGNSKIKDIKKENQIFWISQGSLFGLAAIAYILLGLLWTDQTMGWKMGWILFLLPPVIFSIISAVRKRKFTEFVYPIFVTMVYLTLGFLGNYLGFEGWTVYWFLFITIPAFYLIFGPIDNYIHRHDHDTVIDNGYVSFSDDNDDDDDEEDKD